MNCSMCGNDNPPKYSFCLSCGTRLNDETTLVSASKPVQSESGVQQTAKSCIRSEKGYLKWLGMGVLAIAFLGLFVVAEYFYQKSAALERRVVQSSSPPSQVTPTDAPSLDPQTTSQPTPNTPTPNKALSKASPTQIPPSMIEPSPTLETTLPENYNRIFSPKEVTQKARILARPEPQYTEEARKNQISGTVVLRAVLASDGTVAGIRAVSGLPFGLTEKSISAAQQIKFVPAQKDGRPVSQYIQIEYNFNLY